MRLGLVIVLHVVNAVNVTTMHPTSKWTAVYLYTVNGMTFYAKALLVYQVWVVSLCR